jgi:hypothetical protein
VGVCADGCGGGLWAFVLMGVVVGLFAFVLMGVVVGLWGLIEF